MSYILDALQRADAERERGQVPGLRSRAAPMAAKPRTRLSARWWLPAVGLVLVGLVLLAWWMWPSSAPSPATGAVLAPAPSAPVAVAPAPAPAPAPAVAPVPSLPILAPARTAPAPTGPSKQAPQDPSAARAAGAPRTPAASPAPATTAPAQAAAAPASQEARPPSFGELAADVRARLPQVNVSGATYSANPAHRMLIINGQVLQEGQEIQTGLRLESIGPRSATLDHLGLRYTIGY